MTALSARELWGSNPGPVKSAECRQQLVTAATLFQNSVAQSLKRRDGAVTRYTLRCITTSIMKIGFF